MLRLNSFNKSFELKRDVGYEEYIKLEYKNKT